MARVPCIADRSASRTASRSSSSHGLREQQATCHPRRSFRAKLARPEPARGTEAARRTRRAAPSAARSHAARCPVGVRARSSPMRSPQGARQEGAECRGFQREGERGGTFHPPPHLDVRRSALAVATGVVKGRLRAGSVRRARAAPEVRTDLPIQPSFVLDRRARRCPTRSGSYTSVRDTTPHRFGPDPGWFDARDGTRLAVGILRPRGSMGRSEAGREECERC